MNFLYWSGLHDLVDPYFHRFGSHSALIVARAKQGLIFILVMTPENACVVVDLPSQTSTRAHTSHTFNFEISKKINECGIEASDVCVLISFYATRNKKLRYRILLIPLSIASR